MEDCHGIKLNVVMNLDPKHFIIAPNISYEYHTPFVGMRLNIAHYFGRDKEDRAVGYLRITPEAGISVLGVVTLFGGYNIPLTASRVAGLSGGRVSLIFNTGQGW